MNIIQASNMSDEQWKSFSKFDIFLKSEIYPQHRNGKDSNWQELKNKSLKKINESDISFSNFYCLNNENDVVAFIEAVIRFGNLYFDFDYFNKILTKDILNIILEEIYKLMKERNIDKAFFSTFYERHYEWILKTNIEIFEEDLISRLVKKDIDFSNLQGIIDGNKIAQSYELKLFHEIPEEIYDRFVNYMNEAIIDSNFYHPKKKVIREYTMKDLLERVEDIKDDNCPFYMYMLFDNNNIAAHCSVFIDTIDNKHLIDHKAAGFTSVGRNYRGKNLAKYLKAKMYLKIEEDYPDYEEIFTDTFPWNKYMYRINEQFGFKPFKKGYTFKFTKESLEKFLK